MTDPTEPGPQDPNDLLFKDTARIAGLKTFLATSFEGKANILGVERGVSYSQEMRELAIFGIGPADAAHILAALEGGLLREETPVGATSDAPNGGGPVVASAQGGPPAPVPPAKPKKKPAPAAAAPKEEPVKEVAPPPAPPVEEPEDDLDAETPAPAAAGSNGVDVVALRAIPKLRGVIELFVKAGYDNGDKLVEAATKYRNDSPPLMALGDDWEKRLRRAWDIVVSGK